MLSVVYADCHLRRVSNFFIFSFSEFAFSFIANFRSCLFVVIPSVIMLRFKVPK